MLSLGQIDRAAGDLAGLHQSPLHSTFYIDSLFLSFYRRYAKQNLTDIHLCLRLQPRDTDRNLQDATD